MRILEGKKLTKFFGGLAAVSEVDFDVDQGEIVGPDRPNGAGKTTLFNLISGAIIPDSGALEFKGERLTGLKAHRVCRAGVAGPSSRSGSFPNMSVLRERVAGSACSGQRRACHRRPRRRRRRSCSISSALRERRRARAGDLTLAHQKRLEVARALATQPEVMLARRVDRGAERY